MIRNPRPSFTNWQALLTYLNAAPEGTFSSLCSPDAPGDVTQAIGHWVRSDSRTRPAGTRIMLSNIPTIRRGVVATVNSTTDVDLVAGHGLVSGVSARVFDTSAGAELGDKTVTIVGNNCTWTGAIAGMAAGDQLWCIDDMGAFSVGGTTRDIVVTANTDFNLNGGFDIQGRGIWMRPWSTLDASCLDFLIRAEGDVSSPSATDGSYMGVGFHSVTGDYHLTVNLYNDAGTWKRQTIRDDLQAPTMAGLTAFGVGVPGAAEDWTLSTSKYETAGTLYGSFQGQVRKTATEGKHQASAGWSGNPSGANGETEAIVFTSWDAAGVPAMRTKYTAVNVVVTG